jgi:hypothetical protein
MRPGGVVPLTLTRGTTAHSCIEHRRVNFLHHHQKHKTLSPKRKLCRDHQTVEGSFSAKQKLKLSTISSIQRVAHMPRSLSPTTLARSHTTSSEARKQPHRIWCVIFSHMHNERRKPPSNQRKRELLECRRSTASSQTVEGGGAAF